jgi:predicted ATPase/DNA-binding XRE family transcriptional regulator
MDKRSKDMNGPDSTHANDLLRQERIRCNWRQREVADRLGTTVVTVNRWERGIQQPSAYFRLKLCTLFGKSAEELGFFQEPSHPPIWNIPNPFTPLIGREHDLANTTSLLLHPTLRLLTLSGPGGVGKTRLAIQAAIAMREHFAEGVCFVSLTTISDPSLLAQIIVEALSIVENATLSADEQIRRWLDNKHFLLILDNFEHIVVSAPFLEKLLSACPSLKIMVTSREVLHLQSEREYSVTPLALPDPKASSSFEELADSAAIALFVERAQAVLPTFHLTPALVQVVAQICMRLDGLPLAIELAAARVKLLAPPMLLARLSQGFDILTAGASMYHYRHQTLHNTLVWSYTLLDEEEKWLFRHLGIFVGDVPLETIEIVCSRMQMGSFSVLDKVASLLDKSLLQRTDRADLQGEQTHIRMLITIRDFALARLEREGETEEAFQAHAAYYLSLAEEAEPHLSGTEQVKWLTRLDQEHENLRSSLLWLLERAQVEGPMQAQHALRLCAMLYRFWWTRGFLREGITFLQRALSVREGVEARIQARALYVLAMLVFMVEGVEQTEKLCQESLAIYKEVGETAGIAACLFLQGRLARNRCEYTSASVFLQEAVVLFEGLDDTRQRSLCLSELALVLVAQGKYNQASTLLEESLALAKRVSDKSLMAWAYYQLAFVLFLSQGTPFYIQTLIEKSIALYKAIEDQWHVAYNLALMGEIWLFQGEMLQARSLLEECVAVFKEMGSQIDIAEFQIGLARVLTAQNELSTAQALYLESLPVLNGIGNQELIAYCLEGLGIIQAKQGYMKQAIQLWRSAEVLRQAIGAPLPPVYQTDYKREVTAAKNQLGEQAFETTWADPTPPNISELSLNWLVGHPANPEQ